MKPFLKISQKSKNEIFELCHSAKKCKRGNDPLGFLTSILFQITETIEGGPFGAIQKFSKMSHSAEKNRSERHQDSQRLRAF